MTKRDDDCAGVETSRVRIRRPRLAFRAFCFAIFASAVWLGVAKWSGFDDFNDEKTFSFATVAAFCVLGNLSTFASVAYWRRKSDLKDSRGSKNLEKIEISNIGDRAQRARIRVKSKKNKISRVSGLEEFLCGIVGRTGIFCVAALGVVVFCDESTRRPILLGMLAAYFLTAPVLCLSTLPPEKKTDEDPKI